MKKIESYLDSLFHNAKKSEETEDAYEATQTYLEEIYWEQTNQNERDITSVQQVIDMYGKPEDMFDILDLNINLLNRRIKTSDDDKIDGLLRWKTIYAMGLATAIALMLIAIGMAPLMIRLYNNESIGYIYSTMQIAQPVIASLCIITCIVYINITHKKIPRDLLITEDKQNEIENKRNKFQIWIVIILGISVFLGIVAISMFFLLYTVVNIEVAILTTMAIAAFAIWMISFATINHSKYRVILNYENKRRIL